MSLALFDLDNTLINGDSAQAFSEFLAASDITTPANFLDTNHAYMEDYEAGRLDLGAYMKYTLSPLSTLKPEQTHRVIELFVNEVIESMILPKAQQLLEDHKKAGDELVIISATGSHLVHPIARRFGVVHSLAVDIEFVDGYITGEIIGIPTFRNGKVERIAEWSEQRGISYSNATFYSDSHNDLPLLEAVSRPVAVDPDPVLKNIAGERGWETISLR
ncbi:HAD family hydrolase [Hahella ganghwensis]|uniref:HAD family hydrolase n=1 Tax=Hahella ganghwensis TaxID=286420 RepID=UPI00037B1802|nr:HAD family hydrolase [Hahella ganghwensis]